jgi:diguanylate cyclase (GGDEF)-like protein
MAGNMIELISTEAGRRSEPCRFEHSPVQIGRHPGNQVVLLAPHVSAYHGELRIVGGRITYRDLSTTNGSYLRRGGETWKVDESRGLEVELAAGDDLFLGDPALGTFVRVQCLETIDPADVPDIAATLKVTVHDRLDVGDAARIQGLTADLDRRVLLAMQDHVGRTVRSLNRAAILDSFAGAVLSFCPGATNVSVFMATDGDEVPAPTLVRARDGGGQALPLSKTLWAAARARREAFTFELGDPEFDSAESLKRSAVSAGMCVPLWVGDRLSGLVQVDGRGELRTPFGQRDLEAVAVFSAQLAVSMENARLHVDLERTVSSLRQAQQATQRVELRDPVTKLGNRRLFKDRLTQAMHQARRQRRKVAVLHLDLDGLEQVSEGSGREAGDLLLRGLAGGLRGCLRAQDTVARIGGTEFAVVVGDADDHAAVGLVARKMLAAIRGSVDTGDGSASVVASIGITLCPDDGDEVARLMRGAQRAELRAKAQGGDTYQFFTEAVNSEALQRRRLERELGTALAAEEFVQYFQPVVRLTDSRIVSLEAVLRWNHPVRGLLPPEEFLPVAEESEFGGALGQWSLRSACEQARRFEQGAFGAIRIVLKVSGRQFRAPDFAQEVEQALSVTGLGPAWLELEIGAQVLADRPAEGRISLRRLKELGVSLCIEGYGTGTLSLAALSRLPVDALKLDRALMPEISAGGAGERAAASLLAAARAMGLRARAVGVETWDQLEFLKAHGCEFAQGPGIGKPLPAAELVDRVVATPLRP